jgi:hypothetical protein
MLNMLGDESAQHLRETQPQAFDCYQHVILLTHVPPFKESCWYQGQVSNDEWLPFFAYQAVGDDLREVMAQRLDRRLTVYCGHTYHAGIAQILSNLQGRGIRDQFLSLHPIPLEWPARVQDLELPPIFFLRRLSATSVPRLITDTIDHGVAHECSDCLRTHVCG